MNATAKLLAEWFWTDRWMASSAFLLPIEQRGLYREMLSQAWMRGARLPNDHEAIQRAVGCTRVEWNRCWPAIQKYWRVDGDWLVNDTQRLIYGRAAETTERASRRGLRGAQATAQARAQATAQASAQASAQAPTQAVAQASLEHPLERQPPSLSLSQREYSHQERVNTLRAPARENARNTPKNGSDVLPSDPSYAPDESERAGRFIERYAELHAKYRGVPYVGRSPHFEFQEALLLVRVYDDERLDKLTTYWLNVDDEFANEGTRTIGKFRSRASSCDEKLKEIKR